jgi:hypothetical protein
MGEREIDGERTVPKCHDKIVKYRRIIKRGNEGESLPPSGDIDLRA